MSKGKPPWDWFAGRTGPQVVIGFVDDDGQAHMVSVDEASAIAFEDCRPSRRIPHRVGQAHTPGDYWSATTAALVGYESWLESKWMTLLDFDFSVTAFVGQPLTLHGLDSDGPWTHVPDIFARRCDGSALLLDVKNPTATEHHDVLQQTARTRAACDEIGWEYGLFTEPDPQLWTTVSWLAGYRRPPQAGLDYLPRLLSLSQQPVPLSDVWSFMEIPELAKPALFHLCWRQDIVFDLSAPLRESTVVAARSDEPGFRVTATPQGPL